MCCSGSRWANSSGLGSDAVAIEDLPMNPPQRFWNDNLSRIFLNPLHRPDRPAFCTFEEVTRCFPKLTHFPRDCQVKGFRAMAFSSRTILDCATRCCIAPPNRMRWTQLESPGPHFISGRPSPTSLTTRRSFRNGTKAESSFL